MSILRFLLGVMTGALIAVLLAFRLLGTSEAATDLMLRDTPRLDLSINERPLPMRQAPDLAVWRPAASASFEPVPPGKSKIASEPETTLEKESDTSSVLVEVAATESDQAEPPQAESAITGPATIEQVVEPPAIATASVEATPTAIDPIGDEPAHTEPATIAPDETFEMAAIGDDTPSTGSLNLEPVVLDDEEDAAIAADLPAPEEPASAGATTEQAAIGDTAMGDGLEFTVHVPLPETMRLPPLRSQAAAVSRGTPKPARPRASRRQVVQQPPPPSLLPAAASTNQANPFALLFPFGKILNARNNTALPLGSGGRAPRN